MSIAADISKLGPKPAAAPFPLCVDLDGALIRTNFLYECMSTCVRARPLLLFLIPWWALRGSAYLWSKLAANGEIDASRLPYRPQVLDLIASERSRGRDIVLTSRAHRRFAEAVADHLGCFSSVIATEGLFYCAGEGKAALLVRRFGAGGFDHIASSTREMMSWYASNLAILVSAPKAAGRKLEKKGISRVALEAQEPSTFRSLLKAIRPHQAVKNLLIFAPVLLSHRWRDAGVVQQASLLFAAFCMASFAGYLFNDVMDLDADRAHQRKRRRPVAAGLLSLPAALGWSLGLATVSLVTAFSVSITAGWMTAGYLASTVLYSSWLKRIFVADVVILAGLYCYRVIAGGAATGIVISPWTLGFSLFIFTSLALMKRYAELQTNGSSNPGKAKRRSYDEADKPLLAALGCASAMISILVIALYVNSPDVLLIYRSPRLLWLQCPVILLWIMRMWMLAGRGQMDEDPVLYAVKDVWTYALGLAGALIAVFAI